MSVLVIVSLVLAWTARQAQVPQIKSPNQSTLVDLTPWQTAQDLAALAVTSEEQQYAREAERLADHEVDQAFASALRRAQAAAQHRALHGDALVLSQKVTQLEQLISEDQQHVKSLTAAAANLPEETTRATTDEPPAGDLEMAKAQLALDSDELADAQQDLARALGDERGRLQQELEAHEAAMKKYDAEASARSLSAAVTLQHYGTLARRMSAWFDQRTRYRMLQQAAAQASAATAALTAEHNAMEKQTLSRGTANSDRATRLNAMRSLATHSQILSIYDDRIQTQQHLAEVYKKWLVQVARQHQIVFRLLMQSLALLLSVLITAILLDALAGHLLAQRPNIGRRLKSFQRIWRLLIEAVSAAAILLIIFGTPSEMPTIVGLTTAGLTVVLQDFIISFCGWFVLMGKNGIHVGDWVEVNGVGGEVVEIGLFRTHLLETGNWSDQGHPTGRRVTFSNSFAIRGQYFNFTTSGQWMWDEIIVNVPPAADSSETIGLIHKAVLEETEKESRVAEEEWARLGRATGLSQMSAAAAINMRPGSLAGIDVVIRYVTRATNRYAVRNRLYQRAIELLHKPAA